MVQVSYRFAFNNVTLVVVLGGAQDGSLQCIQSTQGAFNQCVAPP